MVNFEKIQGILVRVPRVSIFPTTGWRVRGIKIPYTGNKIHAFWKEFLVRRGFFTPGNKNTGRVVG